MSKEFKVIELNRNERVRLCHTVVDSFAFSGKDVLDDRKIVQGPGIVYAQENVDNSTKNVYIVADINEILEAAAISAYTDKAAADDADKATDYADKAAVDKAAICSTKAVRKVQGVAPLFARYEDCYGHDADKIANEKAEYVKTIAKYFDEVARAVEYVKAAVAADTVYVAYHRAKADKIAAEADKTAAAAADAKKALEKVSDVKEVGLDVKLKTAYMAYRVAEFVWNRRYNEDNCNICAVKAGVLKEVIEAMSCSSQLHTGNAE